MYAQYVSGPVQMFDKLFHVKLDFKEIFHLHLIRIIHYIFIVVESVTIGVVNFGVDTFPLRHHHAIWPESRTTN